MHSPFLCPLLGSTIFCLSWLSEAELGLASVALTRMFSVPATHSVVLYRSLAKAAHCCCPFVHIVHKVCFKKQAYLLSSFESGMDVSPDLVYIVCEKEGKPSCLGQASGHLVLPHLVLWAVSI